MLPTKPIYKKIIDDIQEKIHNGEYQPNSRLPSENEMAKIYSASVPTVRKALSELVYKDVIFRIKGNGTFVSNPKIHHDKIPNAVGRGKASQVVCFLIFCKITDNYLFKMIRGAQTYLFEKGYSVNIMCGDNTIETEEKLIRECLKAHVGGIIMFSDTPENNIDSIKLLQQQNIPVVMIDRGLENLPCTLVSCYNLDGGYQMTRYLIENNHKRILFAAERTYLNAEKERIKGYKLALGESDITIDPSMIIEKTSANLNVLIEKIKQYNITAVQCVNDKIAQIVIHHLQQLGYNVPQDISVAGFDDTDQSEYTNPKITTIAQPFEDMGKMAGSRLLLLIKRKSSHSKIYLPVELKIKDSVSTPK